MTRLLYLITASMPLLMGGGAAFLADSYSRKIKQNPPTPSKLQPSEREKCQQLAQQLSSHAENATKQGVHAKQAALTTLKKPNSTTPLALDQQKLAHKTEASIQSWRASSSER